MRLPMTEDEKTYEAYIEMLQREILTLRMERQTLLDAFCRFAESEGYLDSDWWSESPTLIEKWENRNEAR